MRLSDVQDELGAALAAVPALRVFPYWAETVSPPAAIVGFPEEYEYDSALARGADRLSLPLVVVVPRVDARTARDELSRYVDGAGPASVKAAIEAAAYTACDSVRVQSAEFGVMSIGGVDYLAATFQIDVIGSGS